jgi:hypothetical protein
MVAKSGIGLPHSMTLARVRACHWVREVVECGSPMPLLLLEEVSAVALNCLRAATYSPGDASR